ncbi:MAG: CotH kinase family protein [Polyangiaceae bacterium]|nr:CotH kinase family protein [Polyangiaceae bacterium]
MEIHRFRVGVAATVFALGACAGEGGDGDAPSPICLTEIMYHPVLEESFEDDHEFIEIHNPTTAEVGLQGYRLTGGIEFEFPNDASIAPGGYAVVAKNRDALLGVTEYALDATPVFGDFSGDLDNGGDTVTLARRSGTPESVTYGDQLPWPVAADALGVGEDWLPSELLPLESHRYRGVSLERVSCAMPVAEAGSWVPSPIDGATPGRVNAGVGDLAPPVVLALATPHFPITERDPIAVTATLGTAEGLGALTLEHFVDDPAVADEPTESIAMTPLGDAVFEAVIPAASAGSLVRYRVLLDGEPLSPRPSDPFRWHGAFVDPELATTTRTYHLFISPDDWTELWDNIDDGRTSDCDLSPTWDVEVPGVFVHEGRVYDVRLRYQGSMYNRTGGNEIRDFPYLAPARPRPLRALSWHIKFPRYARFHGTNKVTLNKLVQGCPGITSSVGYELFRRAGLAGPATRFVRLQVNGGYYHYMQELGAIDESFVAAYQAGTDEPIGHLFKSAGSMRVTGLLDCGDGRLLPEACGHSSLERYAAVYERKTWDWAGHDDLIALIEGLHAARDEGDFELRDFLASHFDVDRMLTYVAVNNWLGAWDDMFHNYYLYQRRSDARWYILPWDLDLTAGGYQSAEASIYIGEEGDPDNREGLWNYFKDAFLHAYRAEYVARLQELNRSLLNPATIEPLLAATLAELDRDEAEGAPAGVDCNIDTKLAEYRDYAVARHAFVAEIAVLE